MAAPTDMHERAMQAALSAAGDAASWGDVPVGAAIFSDDEIIAVGSNERELWSDPTAHAEIVAIRRAADVVHSWRLEGLGLAVTLEPCSMCAGAIVNARLSVLVYGTADPKAGAVGSLYNICQDPRLNHELEVRWGVQEDAATELLQEFFRQRRPSDD